MAEDGARHIPLPGQLHFPAVEPEIPAATPAQVNAWHRGRSAALDGLGLDACPYPGRTASSRAFRKMWRDGFESITLFPIEGIETNRGRG